MAKLVGFKRYAHGTAVFLLLALIFSGCESVIDSTPLSPVKTRDTAIEGIASPVVTYSITPIKQSPKTLTPLVADSTTDICAEPIRVQHESGKITLNEPLVYLRAGKGLVISDKSGSFRPWLLRPLTDYAAFESISQDGRWITFGQNHQIVVMAVEDTDERIEFLRRDEWSEIWGWVSPSDIAIREVRELDTDLVILISPFSDPPGIRELELAWQLIPEFNNPVYFSPDFKYALYQDGLNIALYDINARTNLWTISGPGKYTPLAGGGAWSRDGLRIALTLPGSTKASDYTTDLAILDTSGTVIHRSDLSNALNENIVRVRDWSPNGQYLPVFLYHPASEQRRLLIFDSIADRYLDECIVIDESVGETRWSSDSQQFAFMDHLDDLVVFDMSTHQAITIAHGVLRLTGWITMSDQAW